LLERARLGERVEVGCLGGHGRTGTALACLAILTGHPPGEAVAWVRANYCADAVETAEQELNRPQTHRQHVRCGTTARSVVDSAPDGIQGATGDAISTVVTVGSRYYNRAPFGDAVPARRGRR
jgi:hypothetical protein